MAIQTYNQSISPVTDPQGGQMQNQQFGQAVMPSAPKIPNQQLGGKGGLMPQPPMGNDNPIAQLPWTGNPQSGMPPPPQSPPAPAGSPTGTLSPWSQIPDVNAPIYNDPSASVENPNDPNYRGTSAGTQFGGQKTIGAEAGAADYAGVQGFSDAAYQNARRYLDPQQAQQNRRMDQELINKGVDPRSAMGQQMGNDLSMRQGDQNAAAAFNAMQFGQGIQNQMFGQDLANTQQAGQMQQADWQNQNRWDDRQLQKYGMDQGFNLGKGNLALGAQGQDLQRYGMDQAYNLGKGNLELGRQKQDFSELTGWNQMDYQNDLLNQNQEQWKDNIGMALMGKTLPPSGGGVNPSNMNTGNPVQPWSDWWKTTNMGQGG